MEGYVQKGNESTIAVFLTHATTDSWPYTYTKIPRNEGEKGGEVDRMNVRCTVGENLLQ